MKFPNDGSLTDALALVRAFHAAVEHPIGNQCRLSGSEAVLRGELIREESAELLNAISQGRMVDIADGCADLIYVVLGLMVAAGIPGAVIDEVHRSNMSKLDAQGRAIKRPDGKVVKGPGYTPPVLTPILVKGYKNES